MKEYKKEYRTANKERLAAQKKAWRENNKERLSEYYKAYREANKYKEYVRKKAWREANPDYHSEYKNENRERINEWNRAYEKKRYVEDVEYRTKCLLRRQTRRLGDYKNKSMIELVGISPEEFHRRNGSPSVEELKDLDIDHIVPLSWFDLTNEEHVRVACNWTNLQYLNSNDNRFHKRDRYAGRPDAILGYRDEFDLQKHVSDMIEFLNETK